jgi:hypothetical protein
MATFFALPQDDFTLVSGVPKARHYIAESGKGSTAISARSAAPDCSPVIWRASPASSSSCWAAWTGPN